MMEGSFFHTSRRLFGRVVGALIGVGTLTSMAYAQTAPASPQIDPECYHEISKVELNYGNFLPQVKLKLPKSDHRESVLVDKGTSVIIEFGGGASTPNGKLGVRAVFHNFPGKYVEIPGNWDKGQLPQYHSAVQGSKNSDHTMTLCRVAKDKTTGIWKSIRVGYVTTNKQEIARNGTDTGSFTLTLRPPKIGQDQEEYAISSVTYQVSATGNGKNKWDGPSSTRGTISTNKPEGFGTLIASSALDVLHAWSVALGEWATPSKTAFDLLKANDYESAKKFLALVNAWRQGKMTDSHMHQFLHFFATRRGAPTAGRKAEEVGVARLHNGLLALAYGGQSSPTVPWKNVSSAVEVNMHSHTTLPGGQCSPPSWQDIFYFLDNPLTRNMTEMHVVCANRTKFFMGKIAPAPDPERPNARARINTEHQKLYQLVVVLGSLDPTAIMMAIADYERQLLKDGSSWGVTYSRGRM